MAWDSWAELFDEPSWSNLWWAILDTAAIAPYLPSTSWVRKWNKKVLKDWELKKFAKKNKDKVKKAIKKKKHKTFTIDDKVFKEIDKKYKWKENEKLRSLVNIARLAGFASSWKVWIKRLKWKKKYVVELWLWRNDIRVAWYYFSENIIIFDKFTDHKWIIALP